VRREGGTISVITTGFFVVLGLLAVVVVNASAAFLQRQELDNLADGAALAAADGLNRADFYRRGVSDHTRIDQAEARRLVLRYLAASGERVTAMHVSSVGDKVQVRLERSVALTIAPPGWGSRTKIVGTARSQLRLGS